MECAYSVNVAYEWRVDLWLMRCLYCPPHFHTQQYMAQVYKFTQRVKNITGFSQSTLSPSPPCPRARKHQEIRALFFVVAVEKPTTIAHRDFNLAFPRILAWFRYLFKAHFLWWFLCVFIELGSACILLFHVRFSTSVYIWEIKNHNSDQKIPLAARREK